MTYQKLDIDHGQSVPVDVEDEKASSDEKPTSPDKAGRHSVKAMREWRAMSVLDLAHRAGMLPHHIQAIEAGLQPTLPELQSLAAALNVPVEWLV